MLFRGGETEEETRRRMAMQQLAFPPAGAPYPGSPQPAGLPGIGMPPNASPENPFGPGRNAPAALAGAGALAASGMPGGLWGPSGQYSGTAGSPLADLGGQAQALADTRGPLPPTLQPPAGAQGVQSLLGPASSGWMTGWGAPAQTPGVVPDQPTQFPGGAAGAGAAGAPAGNAAENARQVFKNSFEQNLAKLSGGSTFSNPDQQATAMKLATAETAPLLQQMSHEAAIKEAALKHSPDALKGQTLLTLMGGLAGSGKITATGVQQAIAAANEVSRSLDPGSSGATPGPNNPVGPVNKNPPTLDQLAKTDQFLQSANSFLPKAFSTGSGVDVHGKIVPGQAGALEAMTPEAAGTLMQRLGSSGLNQNEQHAVLDKLMDSPAGQQIRDALLTRAGAEELASLDPDKIPKIGTKSWLRSRADQTQFPGDLEIPGAGHYNIGGNTMLQRGLNQVGADVNRAGLPYNQFNFNGQILPIDQALNPLIPGKLSGASPDAIKKTIDNNSAIRDLIFKRFSTK
jgi:hypothetical protein